MKSQVFTTNVTGTTSVGRSGLRQAREKIASGWHRVGIGFTADLRWHHVRLATASRQNPNKFMTN